MANPSPVYSYCFYRNKGLVGRETLICPPGYTMVLRYLTVYAHPTPGSEYILFLEDYGTGAALVFVHVGTVPVDGRVFNTWEGKIVIGAGSGEGVVIDCGTQSDISLSGYLLYGQAPVEIVGSPPP